MKTVQVLVSRFDLSKGEREARYEVAPGEQVSILDLLRMIVEGHDPTLSFRSSCRVGVCGTCAVVVDGREAFACQTAAPPPVEAIRGRAESLLGAPGGNEDPHSLRGELEDAMWEGAGVMRTRAGLARTIEKLYRLEGRLPSVRPAGSREFSLPWNEALDMENLLVVAAALCHSALARTESRGAHHRRDHRRRDDEAWLRNVIVSADGAGGVSISTTPVRFPYLAHPGGGL